MISYHAQMGVCLESGMFLCEYTLTHDLCAFLCHLSICNLDYEVIAT